MSEHKRSKIKLTKTHYNGMLYIYVYVSLARIIL